MARNTGISYLSDTLFGGLRRNVQEAAATGKVSAARVTDISLNTNSPLWAETGEWKGVGTIQFQFVDSPTSEKNFKLN